MLCENTALQKSKVLKDPCFWVLNQHVSYNDPFAIGVIELGRKFNKFIVGALLPFYHHIFLCYWRQRKKYFFEPGLKISQREF
jgi:hypothetical protein